METVDYLEQAAILFEKRPHVQTHEARMLIGGPFSLEQINQITGVPRGKLIEFYRDNERPGGELNPDSLRDLAQLRYLKDIGANLNAQIIGRVLDKGTSIHVLARFTGVEVQDIEEARDQVQYGAGI